MYKGSTEKAVVTVGLSIVFMMYILKFIYDWCCGI